MNTLTVWWDGAADGALNMGADECLAREAESRGGLLVRCYGWSATTVSLGAFQKIDEARRGISEIQGLQLVRRPSGGGAIVHGSDMTYAAAVPKSHPWGATPQILYDALHGAMADALAGHGIVARPSEGGASAAQPETAGRDEEASFFCFDRRAAGDLVVDRPGEPRGVKIMGSAQRRLAGVVLQHGSLLLRHNATVAGRARHPAAADLVGGAMPDHETLAREWVRRIADRLGARLDEEPKSFLVGRDADIAKLSQRFREEWWTARR